VCAIGGKRDRQLAQHERQDAQHSHKVLACNV
jgi:hypothetical protein